MRALPGRRHSGVRLQQDPQAAVSARFEQQLAAHPLGIVGQVSGGGDVLLGQPGEDLLLDVPWQVLQFKSYE